MTAPRHFPSMGGTTYTVGRILLAFKRHHDQRDAAFTLVESTEPTGVGAGLHRHDSYEETFVVCAGSYRFRVGDREEILGPGDTVFVPRGVAHAFTCTSRETGHLLTISTPAGVFEAFIVDLTGALTRAAEAPGAPPPDVPAIAARHGIEFLG